MNGIFFVGPIRDVNHAAGTDRHRDGTKTLVPSHENFSIGFEGSASWLERKRLDQIIAPRCAHERIRVLRWPADPRTPKQARRRFAGPGDHAERAGKFAIPR